MVTIVSPSVWKRKSEAKREDSALAALALYPRSLLIDISSKCGQRGMGETRRHMTRPSVRFK